MTHRHIYRIRSRKVRGLGFVFAQCSRCGRITFRPWWPFWKEIR